MKNTANYLTSQKPDESSMILLEWIRTEFNLPQSIRQMCSIYYLRVWAGNYVNDKVISGILIHENQDWIVHFQSSRFVVMGAERVACSFREYQGKNYVVIKVWDQQKEQS
jgi:hypothetical protein